jgi:hypothetical protein
MELLILYDSKPFLLLLIFQVVGELLQFMDELCKLILVTSTPEEAKPQ